METLNPSYVFLTLFLFLSSTASSSPSVNRRTYIIHMDKSTMPPLFATHHDWYTSILSSLSFEDDVSPSHLYSYTHVMDGFSAVLSRSHLNKLEKTAGHLAAYPETFAKLHTTRTPDFLGLNRNYGLWPESRYGNDMIVGVLDTGVWPESESFKDYGMPPVPERWRGVCETGVDFNSSHCNKKLIGARSFSKGIKQQGYEISKTNDYDSPRDFMGHGSHTTSTVAGTRVEKVDYFGYAKGTATGIAPLARLAMYKVVFFNNVSGAVAASSDLLAGMDQAIEDGVDVLSLSLGLIETPFDQNPIAVGAFAAMKNGVFVSCSAGNEGPHAYTILNGAPWITTVGAGTIDRDYAARVTMGDDDDAVTVTGRSAYPENLFVSGVPIYFGHGNRSKELCTYMSLDPEEVAGNYIFCDIDSDGQTYVEEQMDEMDRIGSAGAIFNSDSGQFIRPKEFYKPFVIVTPTDGKLVKNYILNSKNATIGIKFQLTVLGTKPAPQVAYFSSRGPDRQSPWILKPDILAPGVNILAAWAPNRGFAAIGENNLLLTDYAIISGTSMSCPHIAGIAALLKAAHRDWSAAAIRSAMMTTADVTDNADGRIIDMTTAVAGTPLDFGGGHICPNKAMDPGLVYDIEAEDYVNFLCGLNYTSKQIKIITRESDFSCEKSNLDLNYPSFMVILNNTNTTSVVFKRVLTNVADNSSMYHAVVQAPKGMVVSVNPDTIYFAGIYSKAEFDLTVKIDVSARGIVPNSDYIGNYGFLSWYENNGKHIVKSPIVFAFAP